MSAPRSVPLAQLARECLRLGATGFGGPAAHIAMMEEAFVHRRGWLSREEYLDLVGAANLIPGPNSTEVAIHVGRVTAGARGLLVAGACFIAPAVVIVMAIAWAYARYGTLPAAAAILWGVKPVIVAIIVHAMARLARTAIKTWQLGVVAGAAAAAVALGVHELAVLLGAGAAAIAFRTARAGGGGALRSIVPWPLLLGAGAAAPATAAVGYSLGALVLFFLKVGAVLYGSGYVLIAFLRADLVERWHWLTEAQLLDAVAVGQITPGPVFTTATFIGYQLGGPVAALAATVAIFLPAFVFVAASGPLLPRLRRSPTAGAFLDGVNAASLALLAVVAVLIARDAVVDAPAWPAALALAGASLAALAATRINPTWLVVAGAVVGAIHGVITAG